VDPRDQRIAEQNAIIAAQAARIAAQDARIVELEAKIEQLTALVEKLMTKLGENSGNSHLPPSSDGPGGRAAEKKPSSNGTKKKRGGQPGHEGHERALLPLEQVDRVVELYPKECESCWAALPEVRDENATRYQLSEVPPVRPHTTEYRRNAVTCCCGYTTVANVDEVPASPFGPRLMSLIALLTGVYHISRRQTVELLHDVLGVLSLGAVSAVEARVSDAVEDAVQEAHDKIADAPVKHADATSWIEAGKLRSLWTIATEAATVFKIFTDGAAATIKPLFGACRGILVSDRATVFSFWDMARRQICWAHLLRKFVSFSQRAGPAGELGRELLGATAVVFRYWHDLRDRKLDRATFRAWMAPLRAQLEGCLERAAASGIAELSGSCQDILAHRAALWTFVERTDVEPTNNHAERELRGFVLWRKRSFGAQSERGHLFAERVMTVAHTARKQGKNVLGFLTACCTAQLSATATPSLFAPERAAA
jgi:transposase